jgi:hypothetical protein
LSLLETTKEQIKGQLAVMDKPEYMALVDDCQNVAEVYAVLQMAQSE